MEWDFFYEGRFKMIMGKRELDLMMENGGNFMDRSKYGSFSISGIVLLSVID